jgi:hypothetical protein
VKKSLNIVMLRFDGKLKFVGYDFELMKWDFSSVLGWLSVDIVVVCCFGEKELSVKLGFV